MATRMDMDTGRVQRDRGDVWPWVLLAIVVIAAVIWWASTMANNTTTTGTTGAPAGTFGTDVAPETTGIDTGVPGTPRDFTTAPQGAGAP